MSLGILHDNYNAHAELNDATGNPVTTYIAARDNMLKRKENARLFTGRDTVSRVHNDSAGIPTIGYGFNLQAHTAVQIRSALTHAFGGGHLVQSKSKEFRSWKRGEVVLLITVPVLLLRILLL